MARSRFVGFARARPDKIDFAGAQVSQGKFRGQVLENDFAAEPLYSTNIVADVRGVARSVRARSVRARRMLGLQRGERPIAAGARPGGRAVARVLGRRPCHARVMVWPRLRRPAHGERRSLPSRRSHGRVTQLAARDARAGHEPQHRPRGGGANQRSRTVRTRPRYRPLAARGRADRAQPQRRRASFGDPARRDRVGVVDVGGTPAVERQGASRPLHSAPIPPHPSLSHHYTHHYQYASASTYHSSHRMVANPSATGCCRWSASIADRRVAVCRTAAASKRRIIVRRS